jgi:cell division GTPase FtsZ
MDFKTVSLNFSQNKNDKISIRINEFLAFFEHCGNLYFGTGEAEGETRAIGAVTEAIDSFKNRLILTEKSNELFESLKIKSSVNREEITLKEAQRVLVNIVSDGGVTAKEVNKVIHRISDSVSKECDVYYGQTQDNSLKDVLRVIIIATDKSNRSAQGKYENKKGR